ncbi:MAG: LysR family transcriptional regulator [Thermodesulfobacteriota bacterium]
MPDKRTQPVVRLNVWLEDGDGMLFGHGRALLLRKIEEHGSLRKAAEDLKMSYRAAWGKLRKSEELLGFALVRKLGGNKSGLRLSGRGKTLMDNYFLWYETLERQAQEMAGELFGWEVQPFRDPGEQGGD